ncbi:MAG: tRNA pseudouridine(55) synthase TruB [Spirochaetaceae bacterium]|jgi:tRNA pseudouridine55 synthase|nr:tRNA pseudouridine(55) synthase TruB [Spirochaetaceae bacterium]
MRYFLYDKPAGVTSFDALRPFKKALNTGKVGHTGTLDKFATGLMIILAGRALKLARFFSGSDKSYQALVCLGAETDTLDPEGGIIARASPPSEAAFAAALEQFRGTIAQVPPVYSAVHVNGVRAHIAARSGAVPELKSRAVCIYELALRSYTADSARGLAYASLDVRCSSGTYIRALARDIALAAASRAHLAALRRTSIGGFAIVDADAEAAASPRPVDRAACEKLGMFCADIDERAARVLRHGGELASAGLPPLPRELPPTTQAAFFFDGNLTAILETKDGRRRYGFVAPA